MKKLFYYLSVVALFVLTACNGATSITPDKDAVDFTLEGGEESVNISADGSWDVAECPSWVKADAQENDLIINVSRNETGSLREGIIIISSGHLQEKITVKQAAKCTHITPETDKVEFEKEGGTQTVNIDTDGLPQVEAPEGFTATYAAGVLTINTSANEDKGKSGEIKLSCEDQSATIVVSQKGNVCSKCGGSGKIKCPKCHGKGYTSYGGDAAWGCKSCGGRGYEGEGMDVGDCLVRGSGRIRCPQCGGSGR